MDIIIFTLATAAFSFAPNGIVIFNIGKFWIIRK